MPRKLLLLLASVLSLSPVLCAAQLQTTLQSQANGNATTPYSTQPAQCAVGATGIDVNGNGVCVANGQSNLTAQTAALTGQVLCTAANCPAGFYQVTFYAAPTTTATAGTFGLQLLFTDDVQAQTVSMISGLSLLSKAPGSATYTLYTAGTASITFNTFLTGAVGSPAYSIHASIRRVG